MDILCNNINCDGIGMRRADWDNFRECQDIVLNGQVIWVGNVLSPAVKSQIYEDIVTTGHHSASLAAEVWRAANLYCKSHAASHQELTAQGKLLSAFVNADKDMYCSLPLALTPEAQSALPKRSITPYVANSYFKSGIVPNQDTSVLVEFKAKDNNGSFPFCARQGFGNRTFNITSASSSSRWANGYNNNANEFGTFDYNWHVMELRKNKSYADGVLQNEMPYAQFTCPSEAYIFAGNTNGTAGAYFSGYESRIVINHNGTDTHFIPSKISNTMELLDLETLTLATRVGTFTEQKDIPNS